MINSIDLIEQLLKAKTECIWIKTYEELEVIKTLKNIINNNYPNTKLFTWSFFAGLSEECLKKGEKKKDPEIGVSPDDILTRIINEQAEGTINKDASTGKTFTTGTKSSFWIFKDFHLNIDTPAIIRGIRDCKEREPKEIKGYNPIIIISPIVDIPMEDEKLFEIVDFDTPSKKDISILLNKFAKKTNENNNYDNVSEEEINTCINLAQGLTYSEIKKNIKMSLVRYNTISSKIFKEARIELVKKTGILEYKETTASMDEIGGNNVFKEWVEDVSTCFSKEAEEFGVIKPKGFLAVGLPGTCKTLSAEMIANKLGLPLIVFKMANIMHSHVGQSERNMESALKIIQACSPCVLLIDEVEKALGGM